MRKRYTSCGLQALRFRRWSRKGYAAFVSRQRACTMGTLRCHIVERLQQKNGMPVACMPACGCSYETADALAGDTGGVPADVLPAGMAFFVTACYGVAADAAAPCAVSFVYDEIFPAGSSGLYPGLPAGCFWGGGSFLKELWEKTFFPGKETKAFFAKVGFCLDRRCWLLSRPGLLLAAKGLLFRSPRGLLSAVATAALHFFVLKQRNEAKKIQGLTSFSLHPGLRSLKAPNSLRSNSVAFFTLSQVGLLNASLGKALYRSIAARAPARHLRRREEVTAYCFWGFIR